MTLREFRAKELLPTIDRFIAREMARLSIPAEPAQFDVDQWWGRFVAFCEGNERGEYIPPLR